MAKSREHKEELVAQYVELLNESRAVFLTEYRGVNVVQMEELRSNVRNADGAFHVTKNTLLRTALEQSGQSLPDEMLLGQTAAGFALGELPSLAKALVDFSEESETFVIKGGLMDGKFLSREQIQALADLPSLDELRAQILGLLNAPAQNITGAIAGGVRQVVNVLNAYAQQEEAEA
ncbi:MAG TPA: 50S ribosomal protein L10 [Candidatus Sulfomarinibacteraceae bacterium]|nr:50S ribosomal protein L10 [Candidatus Sulfomarinibacteraceae bacterium]